MKLLSACWFAVAAVVFGACQGDILGLADSPQPLATVQVQVTGDLTPLRPQETLGETPQLRVAVVWAGTYVPDPFCALYSALPGDPTASAVAAAGCRDIFGFVPQKVAESAPVDASGRATLQLDALPVANVLVGEVTGRYGWASLVVYDDRNGNGTLDLVRVQNNVQPGGMGGGGPGGGGGGPGGGAAPVVVKADMVYGASLISMTQPDQRLAYREGSFDGSGWFYPRSECSDPPVGFSLVSAGGFAAVDGLLALAKGEQPAQDAATCKTASLDSVVSIALQATPTVREVACSTQGQGSTGSIRYTRPDMEVPAGGTPPELLRPWACVPIQFSPCLLGLPIPGLDCSTYNASDRPALAVASAPGTCKGTTHYILRGCSTNAACEQPEWDFSTPAKRPPWWPCSGGAGP